MYIRNAWSAKWILSCKNSISVSKYSSHAFYSMPSQLHNVKTSKLSQLLGIMPYACSRTATTTSTTTKPIEWYKRCFRRSFSSFRQFQIKTNSANNLEKISTVSPFSSNTSIMPLKNKEFNFKNYDIIGFDLDCTLLRYNLNEMVPLEYRLLRNFLIEEKGYPFELLGKAFDSDFLQKGLILDTDNGNVLKLSKDATILRATHGTRLLNVQEIEACYGPSRQWSVSTQFFENPMSTWNGPLSERMRTLLDYFDLAASLVFAQAVDVLDSEAKKANKSPVLPYKVWPDLLDGLIKLYSREHFANGHSGYFRALCNEPARYMLRTSDPVLNWLKELRAAGKALFLLTGSNIDFANFTASHVMGQDWQKLFDCIVCYAKKPGFFTMQREFLCVKDLQEMAGSEINLQTDLPVNNAIYSQGNWLQLRAALAKKLGKTSAEVRALYVGDNLIQDVYAPVAHHDLESVSLCEELLAENINANNYEFKEIVGSKFWGSYFNLDNETTLWANVISKYTQLCIPVMDTVADTKVNSQICCENSEGYFPQAPTILMP